MAARAVGVGAAAADARIQARLARLMAARLVLSVALFAAALLLQLGRGGVAWDAGQEGLYATLAFAFLSTVVMAACLGRIRHPGTFGAIQIPTDAVIVTALVHYSGGDESLFSFLYVLIVVFGAMVARRGGAFGAAALCSALHGVLLTAEHHGWLADYGSGPVGDVSQLLTFWCVHAGALAVVAFLGSHLTRELATADAELEASRSDLELLRSLHRRIVDSLLSGLLTTDENGRITSFNPEAEQITGFSIDEAWGLDIDDVIPGSGAAVVSPALAGEEPSKLRLRLTYTSRRGDELHLGLAGSLLRDAEGRPRGSVVIFQDVTRVVQMEAELRRSERLAATGRLAGSIAHEVRNPLAAISGSIQMLLDSDSGGPSPEGARLMEIVLRETDRLNTLITDFLQYAHPRPPKLEAMPLDSLLEDMGRMASNASPLVAIETRIDPGCRVRGDADQVRQLLWNLCVNAIQAMPEGGTLVLGTRAGQTSPQDECSYSRNSAEMEGSSWVEVRVVDTGIGIEPEDCERIFDPFFTTKQEGTGLGLATVHRIVEGHGGILRVESVRGRGTTFRVLLPEAQEES